MSEIYFSYFCEDKVVLRQFDFIIIFKTISNNNDLQQKRIFEKLHNEIKQELLLCNKLFVFYCIV
jgi:hypothetical protein